MKHKFLKTYANLPISLRSDIIAVIDDEPMTWKVCWLEIENDTKLGKKIFKYLRNLEFI